MKKGDVVLIPFPFTNLTGSKKRPALILVSEETDITVSFITTQFKWSSDHDVNLKPSIKNGLKAASLIRLGKLATLDKSLVIGLLGELSVTDMEKVNQSLRLLFQL
jgi:mRNA interferase MazF